MRSSVLRALVLALSICSVHAAVVGGGRVVISPNNDERKSVVPQPGWVEDPTQGGTKKAVSTSWPSAAGRDAVAKARQEAIAKGQKTFELPPTSKFKEMETWIDRDKGLIWVWLVTK